MDRNLQQDQATAEGKSGPASAIASGKASLKIRCCEVNPSDEQARRSVAATVVTDPSKELGAALRQYSVPQDISKSALQNFNKLSSQQQHDFLSILQIATSRGSDGEISKDNIGTACIQLLARKLEDGNPALFNKDRLGGDNLLSHLKHLAFDEVSAGTNPALAAKRDQILGHLIYELSDSLTANVRQGKTTWCVCNSDLKQDFMSNPAEIARNLKEAVLTGKIRAAMNDADGTPLILDVNSDALNDNVRKGASLASAVIITARVQKCGFTSEGLRRYQDEQFTELGGVPAVLKAIDPVRSRDSSNSEYGTQYCIDKAGEIINERLGDKDLNGKMKGFTVSMLWAGQGESHNYHKVLVASYDPKTDSFIAFNPWPQNYKLPADVAASGIRLADGEVGKAGGIMIPRKALMERLNYVVFKTNDQADFGTSHDALASMGGAGEATQINGVNLPALDELQLKKNHSLRKKSSRGEEEELGAKKQLVRSINQSDLAAEEAKQRMQDRSEAGAQIVSGINLIWRRLFARDSKETATLS